MNNNPFHAGIEEAVKVFWRSRSRARASNALSANRDQGERGSVTSGKNMDGFLQLISKVVLDSGLTDADIRLNSQTVSLPGFFRPSKRWDILIIHQSKLIAAIELKSQVGPSFGNNFNNRVEESIGSSHDFWVAFREGAFGEQMPPFLGWIMLVEDAPASRRVVRMKKMDFPAFAEFNNSSYLERYAILCKRLMFEKLYSHASVIASTKKGGKDGSYISVSSMTSLHSFLCNLGGYITGIVTLHEE